MSTYDGFQSVQLRKPKRSKFDLSHERRLSTRMGKLTPVFVSETMPNDTFTVNTEVMLRMAPLLAPLMHRVNVFVHFFFVPWRLIWKDWEAFITNGRLGTETPPVPPFIRITSLLGEDADLLDLGSTADYLGIPPIPDADVALWTDRQIAAGPFMAWYLIYLDYYRDRNFEDDTIRNQYPFPSGDMDDYGSTELFEAIFGNQTRAWEKDYFTSALPWTQRGTEVLLPLQGSGNVNYLDVSLVKQSDGNNPTVTGALSTIGTNPNLRHDGMAANVRIENIDDIELTSSDVSINDFRQAMALQQWYERNALAGSRYNESIYAHFARKTSDSRLQRAEYLGGGKVAVKISEVLTTAFSQNADSELVPPGNMQGHGLSFGNTNRFSYNCEEHGFVIGIMSVMPTTAYMQGIPRMFRHRNTFLDYPWPSFAHLGEQEVYDDEIYADPTSMPVDVNESPVFGYQSRYSDWKWMGSSAHGDFRTNLDFWHMTRKFSTQPLLGNEFIKFEDELQDRVFAVSDTDTLWCYIYNNVSVKRSLPYYGRPNGLA